MKKTNFYLLTLFSLLIFSLKGQECTDSYLDNFAPNKISGQIKWDNFPDFKLPIKVIYGGPMKNTNPEIVLNKGFSHLSDINYAKYIPVSNRAIIYYNPFLISGQPIQELRSPWGNDLDQFHKKWLNDIKFFKDQTQSNQSINSDFFVFDIERQLKADWQILYLRREPSTPDEIKNLNDKDFLERYEKDLQEFYASLCQFFTKNGLNVSISAYADVPVLNNFSGIGLQTWQSWTSNPENLNYLLKDFEKKSLGGSYYNILDYIMPTTYYNYDYPSNLAGYYLSYLLFQIEVNKAWTNKEIIPFVWLRYNSGAEFFKKPIKPWMAEASAIFPFFFGAKGVWLWEDPTDNLSDQDLANYEYFNKGLYRLSRFKDYFQKDYETTPKISSRELFVNQSPIWKGIIKDNSILIVAHNPFASDENAETKIVINYNNLSKEITLKGYEIHLCEYKLDEVTAIEPSKSNSILFPNPSMGELNIQWAEFINEDITFTLYNTKGEQIWSFTENPKNYFTTLSLPKLMIGSYFLKSESKKIHDNFKIIIK